MNEENKKTDVNDAPDSFEAQLAELIRQSGGTVPPKKPQPASSAANEPLFFDNTKSDKEIEAEIDAMINSMSNSETPSESEPIIVSPPPPREKTDEEIEAEIEAMISGINNSAYDRPETNQNTPQNDGQSLSDIEAEIAALQKSIDETEIAALQAQLAEQAEAAENERKQAAETYRLDYELEEMLNSLNAENTEQTVAETPSENIEPPAAPTPEQIAEMENMQARIASLEYMMAEQAKADEETKSKIRTQPESPATISNEGTAEISKDKIEIVTPTESNKESVTDSPQEPEKTTESPSAEAEENKRLREKIASLEYMLSQKAKEEPQLQSATGTQNGDVNSMFKQWFDLEMAAKMKNLITEDEKKKNGITSETETEQSTASDFIKLSDNIYYNVKEKKTYIMRELTAKPKKLPPPKPKTVKKKSVAKKKPPRNRRRLAHNRALGPHRPRKLRRPPPHRPH